MRTHNRVLLAALALCAIVPASVGRTETMLEFIQWGAEGGTPVSLGAIRDVEGAAR
jgi:hypothetical protein